MDDERHIELDVPDLDEFEDDTTGVYIPVPDHVVDAGIKLLQCFVAQWKQEEGMEPDDKLWGQLAASAAQMLAGLIRAWSAYYNEGGARALVDQITWFCHWDEVPGRLAALQGPQPQLHPAFRRHLEDADVVAALLTLHELSERRRKERKQQPAAAEQGPATVGDPGWEF